MEERIKKRRLILPLFIIFTMVFSVLSFSFFGGSPSTQEKDEYGGIKFSFVNNLWVAYINDKEVVLLNRPSLIEDMSLEGFNLNSGKVYLSRNPKENINNELSGLGNLKNFFGITFVDSCISDAEGCEDLPLKKCEDAVRDARVIEVYRNEENRVKKTGECLMIEGNSEFITRVIDKIVLESLA